MQARDPRSLLEGSIFRVRPFATSRNVGRCGVLFDRIEMRRRLRLRNVDKTGIMQITWGFGRYKVCPVWELGMLKKSGDLGLVA